MSIYVMSDIHGLKSRFDTMIKKLSLKKRDHVYILGDVIDRGKDGIKLLQNIMDKDQFTLILGNHELMMLEYYEDQKHKEQDPTLLERWLRNGCVPTMDVFEKLSKKQQEAILTYLKACPLAISDIVVNDKVFYLVHGAPVVSLRSGPAYLHSDFMKIFSPHDFVWNRLNGEDMLFEDRTTIVGHTVTAFYQSERPYAIWYNQDKIENSSLIDIDCGCACDDEHTQLACLRLDDFRIYYF